jgi:pSer/pThr/pTyr-binding forkhead associated (FHA) protein
MALKIVVLKDTKPQGEFIFDQPLVTIGRHGDSDVPIRDPAVSGAHARIERVEGGYQIKDLGSTNGVSVGGRRVEQHHLKHNDLLTIGEHLLHVMISIKASSKAPSKIISKELPADVSTGLSTGSAPVDHASAYLLVVKGGQPGKRITLQAGITSVGEPGVQVAAVSKRSQGHFIIHVDGGKDKSQVPVVNGEPTGFKSRKLEFGDIIEVAGVQMEYRSE